MATQVSLNDGAVASAGALAIQTNGTTQAVSISTGQVATLAQNPILTSGTANGVAYLNGSKAVTSGSALTFDGTKLSIGSGNSTAAGLTAGYFGASSYGAIWSTAVTPSTTNFAFLTNGTSTVINGSSSVTIQANNSDAVQIGSATGGVGAVGIGYTSLTSVGNNGLAVLGNVGIGTSSPQAKLHINSGAGSTQFRMGPNSTSSDRALINYNSTTNRFTIDMSGNDSVVIDGSGNLGLGVTPSAWGSSFRALQVTNASALWSATSGDLQLANNAYFDGTNYKFVYGSGSAYAAQYQQKDGKHIWQTAGSGSAGGTISFTQAMTLDASGNLLVGTTTASGLATGSAVNQGVILSAGTIQTQANANANMYWAKASGYSSGDYTAHFVNNVYVGGITTNGSTTTYAIASDYRLKENVQPMTGALAKVAQLKPVTYTWKASGIATQGFIAHELQSVVPDCVVGEKDALNEDGSIKPQGVDTSFLVATLTAAIQEQQALITQLTARITALESA